MMHCKDTWKKPVPQNKMMAYKQLLDEGVIENIHITYIKSTKETIFEYDAEQNHNDVLKELAKRVSPD